MHKWTEDELIKEGYSIENVLIDSVDLNGEDYGMLQFTMSLSGRHCCVYGSGYGLGRFNPWNKGDEFSSYPHGIEYIGRIMATVGATRFNDMKGKYIRMASKGLGSTVEIIGNIIDDKWFDRKSFFDDYREKDKYNEE